MKLGELTQWKSDCLIRTRDGQNRWIADTAVPIQNAEGKTIGTIGILQDVTERKRVEEELQIKSQQILACQEAERRRVARELHDSVNQILSCAKLRLENIPPSNNAIEDVMREEDTVTAKHLIEQAIEEVRMISQNLRPSELDHLGLAAAIRSICSIFQQRSRLNIDFESAGLPNRLPGEMELNLYRLVQEGLTNVERHAEASEVQIRLRRKGNRIRLTIEDNGRGFDRAKVREALPGSSGLGLSHIQDRVRLLSGTLEIDSTVDEGTSILVQIPFTKRDAERAELMNDPEVLQYLNQ